MFSRRGSWRGRSLFEHRRSRDGIENRHALRISRENDCVKSHQCFAALKAVKNMHHPSYRIGMAMISVVELRHNPCPLNAGGRVEVFSFHKHSATRTIGSEAGDDRICHLTRGVTAVQFTEGYR